MSAQQVTGEYMRAWHKAFAPKGEEQRKRERSMQPTIVMPSVSQYTTAPLPVIPPQPPRSSHLLDPYVMSRGLDHPILMLTRVSLLCMSTHARIPDTLYMHSSLLPELRRQIAINYKMTCTNPSGMRFPLYSGMLRLEQIMVHNETQLPAWIANGVGALTPDMVIAQYII